MLTYFIPALYSMLQIFLVALLGFILVRSGKIEIGFIRTLSRLVVNITLPCWLFSRLIISEREHLFSSLIFPMAAFIIVITGFLLGFLVLRLLKINQSECRVGLALSALGNYGYLPLSIVETLPISLPAIAVILPNELTTLYIGMYLIVINPILWTVGHYFIVGGTGKPRINDLITPPAIGAITGILSVLLGGHRIFTDNTSIFFYLAQTIRNIGSLTVPVILLCLGGLIAQAGMEGFNREPARIRFVAGVSAVRLVLLPCLFFILYYATRGFITLTPVQYWVLFLEMTIPPATNLSVIAAKANKNESLVAQTLLVSYIGYFLFFPLYLSLFLSLPIIP